MDDALGVGFAQGFGHLVENAQAAVDRDDAGGALDVLQALAAHQFHGQIKHAVLGLVEVVDDHGVRVAQLGAGLGLAAEAGHHRRIGHALRMEDLQRDRPLGGDLHAFKHGAEAALSDLALDEVAIVERTSDQTVEGNRDGIAREWRRCGPADLSRAGGGDGNGNPVGWAQVRHRFGHPMDAI